MVGDESTSLYFGSVYISKLWEEAYWMDGGAPPSSFAAIVLKSSARCVGMG
jgi:hypothetical protein